jgi:hypothetical protein
MSDAARSVNPTRVSAPRGGKSCKIFEGEVVITSKRSRGQLVPQADESLSGDNVEVLEAPSIPVNIADHAGPPEVLTDMSFDNIEGLVTKRVIGDADDIKLSTW